MENHQSEDTPDAGINTNIVSAILAQNQLKI
jgi:hypothetical protein